MNKNNTNIDKIREIIESKEGLDQTKIDLYSFVYSIINLTNERVEKRVDEFFKHDERLMMDNKPDINDILLKDNHFHEIIIFISSLGSWFLKQVNNDTDLKKFFEKQPRWDDFKEAISTYMGFCGVLGFPRKKIMNVFYSYLERLFK